MSKVVDLGEAALKRGDLMFLGCPCGSEDGFAVVIAEGGDTPVVTGLVCQGCTLHLEVLYGKVGT